MRIVTEPRICPAALKTVERSRCADTHYEREKRQMRVRS